MALHEPVCAHCPSVRLPIVYPRQGSREPWHLSQVPQGQDRDIFWSGCQSIAGCIHVTGNLKITNRKSCVFGMRKETCTAGIPF